MALMHLLGWHTSTKGTHLNDAIMNILMHGTEMACKYTDYQMHEGVGGCEGPGIILAADLQKMKLLFL